MGIGSFVYELSILYLIGLLGFIGRKIGTLNEHTNIVLTQVILYFTLPALILFSLDTEFSYTYLKDFFWLLLMSAYILMLATLLGYWLRTKALLEKKKLPVYEGLIILGNQGFIGYAVCFTLFKEQGIIYLTMFNVLYFFYIWSYGIYLFTKKKEGINWRLLWLNPGIISTAIGLFLFLTPLSFPSIISRGLESVGMMTIPLSMMVIGSLVAEISKSELPLFLKSGYLWKAAVCKLLIIPLLLLPFIFLPVPFTLIVIAILVSGMPSAPTISLYAKRFGGDALFAAVGVMITTLLCIVTLPLLYAILQFIYRIL